MSTQISLGVKQLVLDALFDVSVLEAQTIDLVKGLSSLASLIRNEHFTTQEAVREELLKTKGLINNLLQGSINEIWDNSISQMPEGLSCPKAAEMVAARQVELKN